MVSRIMPQFLSGIQTQKHLLIITEFHKKERFYERISGGTL
jgi:hypothetical protein